MEEKKMVAVDPEGWIEDEVIDEKEFKPECNCGGECKCGTMEDLKADMEKCGFYPQGCENGVTEVPLESALAKTRMAIDEAMQQILAQSQLPIFLFDYLVTSVLCDIRKADLDTMRMGMMAQNTQEQE